MSSSVRIIAPSRIHFGLLSADAASRRRYGGAGVMVDRPCFRLLVQRAERNEVTGPQATRSRQFLQRWQQTSGITQPVRIEIEQAPPPHVGLGSGTQLGLSIAWGLDLLFDREAVSLAERAASVGRGVRSAVGAHGFEQGGLIVEDGKLAEESLGRLHERIALPAAWCVLLVRFRGATGLAGVEEEHVFDRLDRTSDRLRERLRIELYDRLVPAAREGDFAAFSESVYQYGYSAGECFAARQGGPFLNHQIAEFVDFCRGKGVCGVGQSSWGPTVFCWFPRQTAADGFVEQELGNRMNSFEDVIVSSVAQTGAQCGGE